jgi:hypothetical protein
MRQEKGRVLKPAQVNYLFFSVAMRKATRPSSGTVSSWMLKPLPSACAHALPMRIQ